MVNEDYEPSDSDEAILEVLKEEGRANPYLIREQADLTKQTVNERLTRLTAAGWVKKVVRAYTSSTRTRGRTVGNECGTGYCRCGPSSCSG